MPSFRNGVDANRSAVETLPALRALGAWMHVGDERFNGNEIRRLYDDSDYPLNRSVN
jgi:hypothetical protein